MIVVTIDMHTYHIDRKFSLSVSTDNSVSFLVKDLKFDPVYMY